MIVTLRREEIHFGLSVCAHALGVLISVVNVVRKGALIIKKLREHRPFSVFIPKLVAYYLALKLVNHILKEHALASVCAYHVAKSLVVGSIGTVFGVGGGSKPAFIYSASLKSENVIIIGVKLDSSSGNTK